MEGSERTRRDWRAKKRNQAQAALPASVPWEQRGMMIAVTAKPEARSH